MPNNKKLYQKGEEIGDQCYFIEEVDKIGKDRAALFKCRCGNEFIRRICKVKEKSIRSCGCLMKAYSLKIKNEGVNCDYAKKRDKFNSGDIIGLNNCIFWEEVDLERGQKREAIFICHCGNKFISKIGSVKTGKRSSCGCIKNKDKITHGKTHTAEYRTWSHIIGRIFNPTDVKYEIYGKRGITMCDLWRNDFMEFYKYVGDKPSPKHSLDRIDVNGNYEPGNVRWADAKTQANNMRTNIYLTYQDKTLTATQWSEIISIPADMIRRRKKNGWTDEECLTLPRKYRKN